MIGAIFYVHIDNGFWNTDNYVVWSAEGEPLRPVADFHVHLEPLLEAGGQRVLDGLITSVRDYARSKKWK